jgi:hypothetical protein
MLTLDAADHQALVARGLRDVDITQASFRTLPGSGRIQLAGQLVQQFGSDLCRRVPGFGVMQGDTGTGPPVWMVFGSVGMLVPVRNAGGKIIGLLSRQPRGGYRWISSKNYGGLSPGAPVHVPICGAPHDDARVTEGALKAIVATAHSGIRTIGAAGASHYRAVIPVLRSLGTKRVRLALDADHTRKLPVRRAVAGAYQAYRDAGFAVVIEVWNEAQGKGIDDALLAKADISLLVGTVADDYIERLKAQGKHAAPPVQKTLDELRQLAKPVLDAPDPLIIVGSEIRRQGWGGDVRPAMLVRLSMVTRLLKVRPGSMLAHIIILGPSSVGKSWMIIVNLAALPPEAYHLLPAATATALIHDEVDIRHRIILFLEIDSMPDDVNSPAASALRNLVTDHHLWYLVVIKDPSTGKWITMKISREGPSLLVTTGLRLPGKQMNTRLSVLELLDDPEHIQSALMVQATLELTGIPQASPDLVAFETLLQRLAPWDVVVPFAKTLAKMIGRQPAGSRILRDFQRVISWVKGATIYRHQHRHHEPDGQKRLQSTIEDYSAVYDLAAETYLGTATGIGKRNQAVLDAVQELNDARKGSESNPVTAQSVADKLKLPESTIRRLCRKAITSGWLHNRSSNPKIYNLELGKNRFAPSGLPSPADLAKEARIDSVPDPIPSLWDRSLSSPECGDRPPERPANPYKTWPFYPQPDDKQGFQANERSSDRPDDRIFVTGANDPGNSPGSGDDQPVAHSAKNPGDRSIVVDNQAPQRTTTTSSGMDGGLVENLSGQPAPTPDPQGDQIALLQDPDAGGFYLGVDPGEGPDGQ